MRFIRPIRPPVPLGCLDYGTLVLCFVASLLVLCVVHNTRSVQVQYADEIAIYHHHADSHLPDAVQTVGEGDV